jgi:glycosidase
MRVDVPFEVVDGHGFMRDVRATARAIDSTHYLVGEFWGTAPEWLQGDQFDAVMNYAIGEDVIERFVTGAITGDSAMRRMASVHAAYPEASVAMQFNVVSTHDNARLLTKLGGGALGDRPSAAALARQRLASAFLYALPGVPVTFQGDECAFLGRAGGDTHDEQRYPMQWARCDTTMVAHYRALARWRRALPALASPALRLVRGDASTLAFLRGEPGRGELLALFNAGDDSARVPLPAGAWVDITNGRRAHGATTLDARGWRWLVRPKGAAGITRRVEGRRSSGRRDQA